MRLSKYAQKVRLQKRVALRAAKENVDKICTEVPKTSDNGGGKPTLVSHFYTKHLVL